jgi:hypothetical protein
MMRRFYGPSGKLFLSVLLSLSLTAFSASAFAATSMMAGCQTSEWTALSDKAKALIAYDSAVTRQIITAPPSVLTLTCFGQHAGVSAVQGGKIFSGDLTSWLQTNIINVAAVTADPTTNLAAAPAVTLGSGTYSNCTAIGDLWNSIVTAGLSTTSIPYVTFNDLMAGTAPTGAGQAFSTDWTNAATDFSTLKTDYANYATAANLYDPANTASPAPTNLNFTGCTSAAAVIALATSGTACP